MKPTHSKPGDNPRQRHGDTRKPRRLASAAVVVLLVGLALLAGQWLPHAPQEATLPAPMDWNDPTALAPALTADAAATLGAMKFVGLDGAPVTAASFRGHPMLLNFWATWCAPCAKEMPALDAQAERYAPHGLAVVAVSLDAAPASVQDFLVEHKLRQLIPLRDEGGRNFAALKEAGLPLTLLVRADGTVAERLTGFREWNAPDMQEKLQALVQPAK